MNLLLHAQRPQDKAAYFEEGERELVVFIDKTPRATKETYFEFDSDDRPEVEEFVRTYYKAKGGGPGNPTGKPDKALLNMAKDAVDQHFWDEVNREFAEGDNIDAAIEDDEVTRTVVFDFDGTIMSDAHAWPGFGEPDLEVVARMERCYAAGLEVMIHSCRWTTGLGDNKNEITAEAEKKKVEDYLNDHSIPFTGLWPHEKPYAVFYCDDKAIHPHDLVALDAGVDEAIEALEKARQADKNLLAAARRFVNGSIIDYPRPSLDKRIWEQLPDRQFYLSAPAQRKIMDGVNAVIDGESWIDSGKWLENVLIGSSIATQFYTDETDIDLKIVIDFKKFRVYNPDFANMDDEELSAKLIDTVRQYNAIHEFTGHPFDYYVYSARDIRSRDFTATYDAMYDIVNKRWLKPPKMIDPTKWNREEVVKLGERMALRWAKSWDVDLGQIRRSVRDYQQLDKYLSVLEDKEKATLVRHLQKYKLELETEIEKMAGEAQELINEKRAAYMDHEESLEELHGYINALPEIIQVKMLNHWGYLKLIRDLKEAETVDDVEVATENPEPLQDPEELVDVEAALPAEDKTAESLLKEHAKGKEKGGTIKRVLDKVTRPIANKLVHNLEAGYDYGCLMVELPEDLVEGIIRWGMENVPEENIADDGKHDVTPHITVKYGFTQDDPDAIKEALVSLREEGKIPVKIKLGEVSKFEKDGEDVIKIAIESEELTDLHNYFLENFENVENFPDYNAHLTIAYVKPGSCDDLLGQRPFEVDDLELDRFQYSGANEDRIIFNAAVPVLGVGDAAALTAAPLIFATDALTRLHRKALEFIRSDPVFSDYVNNPEVAEALGAAQKELAAARSEEEIQRAWEKYKPSISFEDLKKEAESDNGNTTDGESEG